MAGAGPTFRVLLELGSEGFSRGVGKARRATRNWRRSIVELDRTVQQVKQTLALVVGAQVVGRIRATTTAYERITGALRVANQDLGDQEQIAAASARQLASLRAEAERLGLLARPLAEQGAQLLRTARGTALAGRGITEVFTAFAEAATVTDASQEQLEGSLLAVRQILSKNKVQTEELLQITERGIGDFNLFARAVGLSGEEFAAAVSKGEVLAEDFLPKLAAELRRTFGPEVERAAQNSQSQFNRLANATEELELALGQTLTPALAESASALAGLLRQEEVQAFAQLVGGVLAENFQLLVAAGVALVALELPAAIAAIDTAITALAANPLALVLLGVAAAATEAKGAIDASIERSDAAIQEIVGEGRQLTAVWEETAAAIESADRATLQARADQYTARLIELQAEIDRTSKVARVYSADLAELSEREGFNATQVNFLRQELQRVQEEKGQAAAEARVLDQALSELLAALEETEESAADAADALAGDLRDALTEETRALYGEVEALEKGEKAHRRFLAVQEARERIARANVEASGDVVAAVTAEVEAQERLQRQLEGLRALRNLREEVRQQERLAELMLEIGVNAEQAGRAVDVLLDNTSDGTVRETVELIGKIEELETLIGRVDELRARVFQARIDRDVGFVLDRQPPPEVEPPEIPADAFLPDQEQLRELTRGFWDEEALYTADRWQLMWTDLAANMAQTFGRTIGRGLSRLFEPLLPQAEGVFEEILRAFLQMLAEMVAAATSAELTQALFGGGGGESGDVDVASQGVDLASAFAGALSSTAVTVALAAAATYAFVAVLDHLSDKSGEIFDFGASSTFRDGELTFATTDPNTRAAAITEGLRATMEEITALLGDSLQSLGTVTILARRDAKAFKTFVGGELVGTFRTAERAVRRAVVRAFSSASVDDPYLQRALEASAGRTVESLVRNLEVALALRDKGLSEAARQLRADMLDAWDAGLQFAEAVREAGFAMAEAAGAEGSLSEFLNRTRARLTGTGEDPLEDQRRIFNELLEEFRSELEAELAALNDSLEDLLATGDATISATIRTGGILDQASGELAGDILDFGDAVGTATVGAIDRLDLLRDRIAYLEAELGELPEPIDPTEIQRPGRGGGERRRIREAFAERLEALRRETSDLGPTSAEIAGELARIAGEMADAERAGVSAADRAEALALELELLTRSLTEGAEEAIQAAGESDFETALRHLFEGFQERFEALYLVASEEAEATGQDLGEIFRPVKDLLDQEFSVEALALIGDEIDRLASAGDVAGLVELRGLLESLETADLPPGVREALEAMAEEFPEIFGAIEEGIGQVAEGIVDSFDLPVEQAKDRLADLAQSLHDLRLALDEGAISSDRYAQVMEQLAATSVGRLSGELFSLLGQVEDLGVEHGELYEIRRRLERAVFDLQIARLEYEIQAYHKLGIISQETFNDLVALFGVVEENADAIFEAGLGGSGGAPPPGVAPAPPPPPDHSEAERFLEQLTDALREGSDGGVPRIVAEIEDLRQQARDFAADFPALGTTLEEVLGQIDDLLVRRLEPHADQLREFIDAGTDTDLSPAQRALDELLGSYRDQVELFEQLAGALGGAQAVAELYGVTLDDLTASYQDQRQAILQGLLDPLAEIEQSLLLGLGPLAAGSPFEQLETAESAVRDLLPRLAAGDVDALESLPSALQNLLRVSSGFSGPLRDQMLFLVQQAIDQARASFAGAVGDDFALGTGLDGLFGGGAIRPDNGGGAGDLGDLDGLGDAGGVPLPAIESGDRIAAGVEGLRRDVQRLEAVLLDRQVQAEDHDHRAERRHRDGAGARRGMERLGRSAETERLRRSAG